METKKKKKSHHQLSVTDLDEFKNPDERCKRSISPRLTGPKTGRVFSGRMDIRVEPPWWCSLSSAKLVVSDIGDHPSKGAVQANVTRKW